MILSVFEIKAIQAEHGDALFVTYGPPHDLRHLLIDGGPAGTHANIVEVLEQSRKNDRLRLEALVVTHYDLDHIQGVIELLNDKPEWLEIDDIWFNGHRHLHDDSDRLGSAEGDTLTTCITSGKYNWNKAFGERAIHRSRCPVELPGNMTVYVLSPDVPQLEALAREWTDPRNVPDITDTPEDLLGRKNPWPPGPFSALESNDDFEADRSVPNGSSIALLLRYDQRCLLLAADSHAGVVKAGLAHHFPDGVDVNLLKVSHHGSKANTDRGLLETLGCRRFLISTSGKGHKHPDNLLIARLLAAKNLPELFFNYDVDHTARWSDELPMGWPSFDPFYPLETDVFIRVDV